MSPKRVRKLLLHFEIKSLTEHIILSNNQSSHFVRIDRMNLYIMSYLLRVYRSYMDPLQNSVGKRQQQTPRKRKQQFSIKFKTSAMIIVTIK